MVQRGPENGSGKAGSKKDVKKMSLCFCAKSLWKKTLSKELVKKTCEKNL